MEGVICGVGRLTGLGEVSTVPRVVTFSDTGGVTHSRKPIKRLDSLHCGIAEEDVEVDIQNPQIPAGHHEVNSLVNLLAKLHTPDIHPDVAHLLKQTLISHEQQVHLILIHKDSNTVFKNVDGHLD